MHFSLVQAKIPAKVVFIVSNEKKSYDNHNKYTLPFRNWSLMIGMFLLSIAHIHPEVRFRLCFDFKLMLVQRLSQLRILSLGDIKTSRYMHML